MFFVALLNFFIACKLFNNIFLEHIVLNNKITVQINQTWVVNNKKILIFMGLIYFINSLCLKIHYGIFVIFAPIKIFLKKNRDNKFSNDFKLKRIQSPLRWNQPFCSRPFRTSTSLLDEISPFQSWAHFCPLPNEGRARRKIAKSAIRI